MLHTEEKDDGEAGELSLTTLPPELCEKLCQFLPACSLLQLPLVSDSLGRLARKEMSARHARLEKRQLMILTDHREPTNILNTVTMLCPGIVLLYDSSQGNSPKLGDHTLSLAVSQPLFMTTSSSLSQCLLTSHLTSSKPKCFSLSSTNLNLSPVLLLSIPVNINQARKMRNCGNWNTINKKEKVVDLLGKVAVTPVRFSQDHREAQSILAKEVINSELDVELYFNTDLMESPNMYEDLDTFLLVVNDPNSDPFVQRVVERFLARVYKPLRVSWVSLVNL